MSEAKARALESLSGTTKRSGKTKQSGPTKQSGSTKHSGPAKQSDSTSEPTLSTVSSKGDDDGDDPAHFRGAGRKFALLCDLWPGLSMLGRPCPTSLPSSAPWCPEWCTSNAAWESGLLVELFYIVSAHHHKWIEGSPAFAKEVVNSIFPSSSILILQVSCWCWGNAQVPDRQCPEERSTYLC